MGEDPTGNVKQIVKQDVAVWQGSLSPVQFVSGKRMSKPRAAAKQDLQVLCICWDKGQGILQMALPQTFQEILHSEHREE